MKFLVIIATFKNEATILKEWITHYLEQGVDHFYLIDDNSDDDYQTVLEPFSENVTIFKPKEAHPRVTNYNNVFEHIRNQVNWVAVCDITQYWYTPENTLRDYLLNINDTIDVISSPCSVFGDPNITHQPESIRTTFINVHNAPFVKTIAKSSVIERLEVNQHLVKSGAVAKIEMEDVRINDYDLLSLEYFFEIKMKRTHPDRYDIQRNWGDFLLQQPGTRDLALRDLVIQRQAQNKASR